MIVMSKQARALLDKMKEYGGSELEYDMCDVEWYAHNFLLPILVLWWKNNGKEGWGTNHIWYLPPTDSPRYRELLAHVGNKQKQNPFVFDWTNAHQQVYHYLCSSILECDFNVTEFKMILDIGSEFSVQEVQHTVDRIRGTPGSTNIAYIMNTLRRNKQSIDMNVKRIDEAIKKSQKEIKKIQARTATKLEVALMRTVFKDIQDTQLVERIMDGIAAKRFKRRY